MTEFTITNDAQIIFAKARVHFNAGPDDLARYRDSDDVLFMNKSKPYVDAYRAIGRMLPRPQNIFELGIFRGGSTVFFHQFFQPKLLVGVELSSKRLVALDAYAKQISASGNWAPPSIHYGVNQADRSRIRQIIESEFKTSIDLVIDDASHFYAETKAAFETVFPSLAPGGIYVIEQWGWSHTRAAQSEDHYAWQRGALSQLAMELVAAFGSQENIISEIAFPSFGLMWLRRGAAVLQPGAFKLDDYVRLRGRSFPSL